MIDAIPHMVWTLDACGRLTYANARWCAYTGMSLDASLDKGWSRALAPDDHDRELVQLRAAADQNISERTVRRRYRGADGTLRWFLTQAVAERDDCGAIASWIYTSTDIDHQVQAEDLLGTSEERYRRIIETSEEGIWITDPEGFTRYVNPRMATMLGYTPDEMNGRPFTDYLHESERERSISNFERRKRGETGRLEYRYVRRDGSDLWALLATNAIADNDGVLSAVMAMVSDITDRKIMERHLAVIARTSTALVESLDRDALVARLAELIVSELARTVRIDLRDLDEPPMAAANLTPTILGDGREILASMAVHGRVTGTIVAQAHPDRHFTGDDVPLFAEIAARAAVAIENATLYMREQRASATLQQALLPAALPQIPNLAFDAIYQPGMSEAQIGGDWYDAVELPDGRVVVSIGDVTGRGLRAAVIMGRVRQAIEVLATYEADPARLLDAADAVLRRAHPEAIVTALVGVIDRKRRTFAYATAGHPTPIVRDRNGGIVILPGSGLPLGLRDAHQPPTSTVVLPAHAMILMYTDGLTESTRDIDRGERRVVDAFADPAIAHGPRPASGIKEAVLFDGSSDDVAVFTIAVGEDAGSAIRGEWSMQWSFDARDARSARNVRELFLAYLKARSATNADFGNAELVFGELIGNVVRHAPGIVDVEIEWRSDAPVLHVLDRGPGYDRAGELPHHLSESGRGLYLVEQLTREFTVTRLPGHGAHARAVLPIEHSA